MGYLYNDIENTVLLTGIISSQIDVICPNQLDAAAARLRYGLFLTNMPKMLCRCIHQEAPVLIV